MVQEFRRPRTSPGLRLRDKAAQHPGGLFVDLHSFGQEVCCGLIMETFD